MNKIYLRLEEILTENLVFLHSELTF